MSDGISFTLDSKEVTAAADETIWQVADREGVEIPHLCWSRARDYRADGNCRTCMVEIEGERVLAASCIRKPTAGMNVRTASERAKKSRKLVFELLLADQPERVGAHDPKSRLWQWADRIEVAESRFPRHDQVAADLSHPAMAVNLDACIHCNLCVRACREIQVNDVIGMAHRGTHSKIVFDFDDPMGESTCVACGECVQACPTGALMPGDEVGKIEPDKKVDSICPYCGVGCQITYNIKDDKILHVTGREDGPANHGRLCVKGRFGFDYVNHAHRLTKPLIRKEGVAREAAYEIDPANPLNHFREASWEEALDVAAAGLARLRDNDGPQSLAGFGSAKGSNEEAYMFQKLVRTGFRTNNVDHCTRLCHASSVAALMETINSGAVTAPFTACKDSDVIVIIGANPTVNHPVAATFIKNQAKLGKELIVMDPRGSAMSRHATHMLQFNGGTDVALLNGLMNVIVEEELFDQNYVAGFTEGFDTLKEHLKAFTPEEMEKVCGISAEEIRIVARKYANANAAIIFWGMGIAQSTHGTDNARCLISLALMCGQIGRPGSGLHPLRGQNNVQGASDSGLVPMFYPDYKSVANNDIKARFEDLWGAELDPNRGLTVVEITDAVHEGVIKGFYIMGENPAMSDPNLRHARKALAKLEHLVVQDLFLTETAAFADVVLPASAWPEKDGTVTNTNRQVQMGRTALDLPGDCRQDWWIIQEIAKRLGLDWRYSHPRDVFAEMRECMPSISSIGWDRLMRDSSVTYPCAGDDDPGQEIIFGDGFPTASKRGKLVPAGIIPPNEQPDSDYPMVLTTGRMLEHWHTGAMTRRADILDSIEPEATAHFSPNDFTGLGIKPGDRVCIESRRGTVELYARVDGGVPDGVVFIPFCYVEAAANLLTNPALDPFGKIPEFKYCAVRMAKPPQAHAAE